MNSFNNLTGFSALSYLALDNQERAFDVVVAKISYDFQIDSSGHTKLKFSDIQEPIITADEYYGDPVTTSVRYESDLSPYKPFLDVVINALAYAPYGRPTKSFAVSIIVGEHQKILSITGPRYWHKQSTGWSLGEPGEITALPIQYEYALGGTQEYDGHIFANPFNPIGMGWYAPAYLKHSSTPKTLPAPQITSPHCPVIEINQNLRSEGFGFYGRSWRDRLIFAGSSNTDSIEETHPFLPKDFNFQYWNGAHPDLQFKHPQQGNTYPIRLTGLIPAHDVPKQDFLLNLPVERLFMHISTHKHVDLYKDLILDTVLICTEERKIFCSYRTSLAEEVEADACYLHYTAATSK